MEVDKRGNRWLEGDTIVTKATDLCRQCNACQRVLMGIDLGHGPLVLPDASKVGLPWWPWSAAREAICQGEALEAEVEGQAGIAARHPCSEDRALNDCLKPSEMACHLTTYQMPCGLLILLPTLRSWLVLALFAETNS